MKFGYQLGSGAVTQRDAFAASGKLNVLRFPMVPDITGTDFDQGQTIGYLQYCQQYKLTPHVTLYDSGRNYPSDLTAYALKFFNFVYSMGIREASFEVGNEMDQVSWIHPSTDMTGDSIFIAYTDLYVKCSNALKAFRSAHPYAQFKLGGTAAATGGWFTARVLSWADKHNHVMDFASWHLYGKYCCNDELQNQIRSVKAVKDIPVWLTEVGYDPADVKNSSTDAVDWVIQFLPPKNVDTLIWLRASPGIWNADGTVTPMGQVIIDYRKVV